MKETKTGDVRPLTELKPGMQLEGQVTRIEIFGAFVDVGAEIEGLIHISMLKRGHVNRVEDELEVGQQVVVWVRQVDPNAGRLELTMIKPVALKWGALKPGMRLKGTVTRLADFGAFIDIGAEREGLVHVSEMSNEYVSSPKDIVSMGDSVEVNVLEIDRKRRQIRLSMKSTEFEYEEEEEQPEEKVPTAMELALREALEDTDEGKPVQPAASERSSMKDRRELEDILSRTLEHRVRTGTSEE